MTTDKLTWTKDKPTVAGWYWARGGGDPAHMLEATPNGNSFWISSDGEAEAGTDLNRRLFDDYEWAGPIPEPGEPCPYTVDDMGYLYKDGKPVSDDVGDVFSRIFKGRAITQENDSADERARYEESYPDAVELFRTVMTEGLYARH